MKEKLQEMVNNYGFGISAQNLVCEIYNKVYTATGKHPVIVNERYLEVEGKTYQFRKTRSKGHWTVAEF